MAKMVVGKGGVMTRRCFVVIALLLIFCAGFGTSRLLHSRERGERNKSIFICAKTIPQELRDLYTSRSSEIDAYLNNLETHMKEIVFQLNKGIKREMD